MTDVVRPGARGEQVSDIQGRLAALGYAIAAEERGGIFGPATEEAARAFQRDRGLDVDGLVGPDTWRELVEASWRLGTRTLYLRAPHMRGDDVRDLQDRLAMMGFDAGRADGIFGPQTARAVEEFQRNYGINPDGIVAEATVRALAGLPTIAGETSVGTVRQLEALRVRPGSVAGMRIVLDPGHGADDPGFLGPEGAREADVGFGIVSHLDAALAAAGAHTFLTRRADANPEPEARASLANALEADLFISVHAAGEGGAAASFYGHKRFRSEAGALLASLIVEELSAIGARAEARAKTMTVLRETRMPAVLIEAGALTDAEQEQALTATDHQERLADAIAQAVIRFAREPVRA